MGCLHWIVLTFVQIIAGQRKTGGIFHLLKGKKSAQTIQDAYLFNCSNYVCSLSDLTRVEFDEQIMVMEDAGLLIKTENDTVLLTNKGVRTLKDLNEVYHFPKNYNGAKYEWNGSAAIFWDRLSLTIQSLSNLNHKNNTFYPISYKGSTQKWVKSFIYSYRNPYEILSKLVYNDLHSLLSLFSDHESNLFVKRLTGYDRTGKTFKQLSGDFRHDPLSTKLYFHSTIHQILKTVKRNEKDYPILSIFVSDLSEQQFITQSAYETNVLLKRGKSIDDITEIRSLKKSTIEDHLIELALYEPSFSYSLFINNGGIAEILETAMRLNTKKLRQIKDELPHYDYFQIRLALTRTRTDSADG